MSLKKNSKFKREIQNSRERMTLKKKIKNFKNSREISKENDERFFFFLNGWICMTNFLNDVDFLNNEVFWEKMMFVLNDKFFDV